jgi:plasmid stability protein
MAHLVLRDLDPRAIETLNQRAALHGRGMEDEARAVLEGALGLSRTRAREAARRLREQWAGRPLAASGDLLRADGNRLSPSRTTSAGRRAAGTAAAAEPLEPADQAAPADPAAPAAADGAGRGKGRGAAEAGGAPGRRDR